MTIRRYPCARRWRPCAAALLLAGLSGLAVRPVCAQIAASTVQEVASVVARYDSAWAGRDSAMVAGMLTLSYVYFTSTGGTWSRAETVGTVASPDYRLHRAQRSEITITLAGPAAVVSSRWKGEGTFRGKPFRDDQRCGLVWLRGASSWHLLTEHCVQIVAPTAGASGGL